MEVQGGPARGRERSGRGTRGHGRGRCASCGRGLDGLEDAAVDGGRGGAQTGARVFIGISLHLSIEKSFAIKSHFINLNKCIVIANEHFII